MISASKTHILIVFDLAPFQGAVRLVAVPRG
jgi:hypothetical protein